MLPVAVVDILEEAVKNATNAAKLDTLHATAMKELRVITEAAAGMDRIKAGTEAGTEGVERVRVRPATLAEDTVTCLVTVLKAKNATTVCHCSIICGR